MEATTAPLKTFESFSKLPTELRLQIWSLATPPARVVEVGWTPEHGGAYYSPIKSRHPPSSLLLANKESRTVFLRRWIKLTVYDDRRNATRNISIDPTFTQLSYSYINPWIDTLYLSFHEITDSNDRELRKFSIATLGATVGLTNLREMAIQISILFDRQLDFAAQLIQTFPNLEAVALGVGDNEEEARGKVTLEARVAENDGAMRYWTNAVDNPGSGSIIVGLKQMKQAQGGSRLPRVECKRVCRMVLSSRMPFWT